MESKRSLSQALQASRLTEEAAAFIAAGAGGKAATAVRASAPSCANDYSAPEVEVRPTSEGSAGLPKFIHSPLVAERRAPVSITVRLPPELPAALLRVSMERKLRGERSASQQDIVAEALRQWLERNATQG